jgi:hypothetical protein
MRGVRLIEFAVWAGPFTARRPQEASAPPRRTAKLNRLAHLSADPPALTGSIREKSDRGLAPCQAFLMYSLTADPPGGGSTYQRTAERAWRMTRSGGAASHA